MCLIFVVAIVCVSVSVSVSVSHVSGAGHLKSHVVDGCGDVLRALRWVWFVVW